MWAKVLRKVVSAGPLASAAPRLRAMPAPAAVSGYAGAGAALGGHTRHYSDTRPLSEIQLQHLEGSNSGKGAGERRLTGLSHISLNIHDLFFQNIPLTNVSKEIPLSGTSSNFAIREFPYHTGEMNFNKAQG